MPRKRGALCQNVVAASDDENETQDHHEKGQNQSYAKVSEKCLNNFRIQNLHLVHVAKT
jgi:hypothetical protein